MMDNRLYLNLYYVIHKAHSAKLFLFKEKDCNCELKNMFVLCIKCTKFEYRILLNLVQNQMYISTYCAAVVDRADASD